MWNKPHLLVLDEPTNYLDREALGALTQVRCAHLLLQTGDTYCRL